MADATGRLAGRTAVVTGAESGIGAGIAVAFAREGADVAVVDLVSEPDAAPVLGAIRERGRRALFVRTDVADDQGVRAMAERVLEEFGHVDVLVNNAGIFTQSLLEDMPVEDWDRVLPVNLRGPFLCTRALIGQMLERGSGRIINVASQLGQIGGVEAAHYSASKAGLIGLTKAPAARCPHAESWSMQSLPGRSGLHCWTGRPRSGAAPNWPSCPSEGSERSRR